MREVVLEALELAFEAKFRKALFELGPPAVVVCDRPFLPPASRAARGSSGETAGKPCPSIEGLLGEPFRIVWLGCSSPCTDSVRLGTLLSAALSSCVKVEPCRQR